MGGQKSVNMVFDMSAQQKQRAASFARNADDL